MNAESLRRAVDRVWASRPRPAWPDPHDGVWPTTDESEYSRVTEPQRYRIVEERVEAWGEVLVGLGAGVEREDRGAEASPSGAADGATGARVLRILPPSGAPTGAAPLVVGFEEVPQDGDEPLPVVRIPGDVDPQTSGVDLIPDCGCDACDRGSDDLLEYVDTVVTRYVGGPVVSLSGEQRGWRRRYDDEWNFRWSPQEWSGSNQPRRWTHEQLEQACLALARGETPELPPGTSVEVSQGWFG